MTDTREFYQEAYRLARIAARADDRARVASAASHMALFRLQWRLSKPDARIFGAALYSHAMARMPGLLGVTRNWALSRALCAYRFGNAEQLANAKRLAQEVARGLYQSEKKRWP